MLSSYQCTLKNLRVLNLCKKNMYLNTDSDSNIIATVLNNNWEYLSAIIHKENWESNRESLIKIFVKEVPKLIDELIDNDCQRELKRVKELLEKCKKPLIDLKSVFNSMDQEATLESLSEDYLLTSLDYIKDYLDSSLQDCLKGEAVGDQVSI